VSRIALIHATPLAVAPIAASFERLWPHAQLQNLLDDSLSLDRARDGQLTAAMTQRFVDLSHYVQGCGCEAILFTCSAFGPAIEAAGQSTPLPTFKPNQAMFDMALATTPQSGVLRVGLLATFAPSIASMAAELEQMAQQRGLPLVLHSAHVAEAMDDLNQGRAELHHEKITRAAAQLPACDVVVLAQFSMAAAQPWVQRQSAVPVLSSPDCAVTALRQRMTHV
jgi:aspartate/glutamate racemase